MGNKILKLADSILISCINYKKPKRKKSCLLTRKFEVFYRVTVLAVSRPRASKFISHFTV